MTEDIYQQAHELIKDLDPEDPASETLQTFFDLVLESLVEHTTARATHLKARIQFLKQVLIDADEIGGYEGRGRRLLVTDDLLLVLSEVQAIYEVAALQERSRHAIPPESFIAYQLGVC